MLDSPLAIAAATATATSRDAVVAADRLGLRTRLRVAKWRIGLRVWLQTDSIRRDIPMTSRGSAKMIPRTDTPAPAPIICKEPQVIPP